MLQVDADAFRVLALGEQGQCKLLESADPMALATEGGMEGGREGGKEGEKEGGID